MRPPRASTVFLSLVVLLTAMTTATAQVSSGSLRGQVVTEDGTALPGTQVTVTAPALLQSVTAEDGDFQIDALPIGNYTVFAQLAGYDSARVDDVTVQSGATQDVRITMTLESVTSDITITAEAPLIEPTENDLSTVSAEEKIENLPLAGRRWQDLAILAPSSLAGDGDGDGDVDQADYDVWRGNFGMTSEGAPGDYNGNGAVDAADYVIWRNNSGKSAEPGGNSPTEPEPPSVTMPDYLANFTLNNNVPFVLPFTLLPGAQDGGVELEGVSDGAQIILLAPGGADMMALGDGPLIYLEALGGSTGPVLKAHIVNPGPEPIALDGYMAVEPVAVPPSQRAGLAEQVRRLPGAHQDVIANFYCLELLKQAPSAGTVLRIAGATKQERFAPAARALEAARRLFESGGMAVEGDPDIYFHSIRQWSLWTLENSFDRAGFLDAFTEHAHKNFTRTGREWSDAVEAAVRRHADTRWRDVQRVLEDSGGADY